MSNALQGNRVETRQMLKSFSQQIRIDVLRQINLFKLLGSLDYEKINLANGPWTNDEFRHAVQMLQNLVHVYYFEKLSANNDNSLTKYIILYHFLKK